MRNRRRDRRIFRGQNPYWDSSLRRKAIIERAFDDCEDPPWWYPERKNKAKIPDAVKNLLKMYNDAKSKGQESRMRTASRHLAELGVDMEAP